MPLPAYAFAGLAAKPAQVQQTPSYDRIRIEGAQRLERESILSYLPLKEGDPADEESLDRALKALYGTGLFADVSLTLEGRELVVKVVENPIVNKIFFEGNDALSTKDLEKEVQLRPRLVWTLPKLQSDVQRILDLYRRQGRFAATVDPKIVKQDQNRVDIIFEINEGKHTGVKRISFVGNKAFDESDLRGVINTQESAWWKFFSSSDFYDPDRTNYDRELLRRFYLNEGYADFRVVSAVAEMTPDRSDFFLTFTVDEGPRYKFGMIDIVRDIKDIDTQALKENLFTETGAWYSADKVERSIVKLTAVLGDRQYAFVDIAPETKKDKDNLTIDVTFHIKPAQPVYIGRIDIAGNTRTLDKVIRREMLVAESDPFSATKIRRSEQRIRDLGFFETVKIAQQEGAQPDRSDLKVEVTEQSTGEISLGAGFSSTDGPLGDFSIRERNFLGRGQDLRLGATISGISKQFDFSFTEPYFLDRDLAAGVDLFHIQRNKQDYSSSYSSYDELSTGGSLRLNYPLSEQLRQQLSYTLRIDEIRNIDANASRFIREQKGSKLTSMVSQELVYDARDSKIDPTEGFATRFSTDLAGLGGDKRYVRARLSGSQYFSPIEKVVISAIAEVGHIEGFGQKIRIEDRFFLGGDSLRGFAYAGVGARDMTNNARDALGGNSYASGSLEVSFPTFMPEDLGFKGHVFSDAGILANNKERANPGELLMTDESPRASVGVGLSWQSPFGLVRLDYAQPVLKKSYDDIQHIHFSFGTRF